jgi:hypothetical protein
MQPITQPTPQQPFFTGAPNVPFEGIFIMLGGLARIIPPLNAVAARRHWERITAMENDQDPDPIGLTVTLVAECLRRNYPETTDEWVDQHVDMDNWEALSSAVFGRSAFRKWADRQAAGGNDPALHPLQLLKAAALIGAPSTPASPPLPAGATATSTS